MKRLATGVVLAFLASTTFANIPFIEDNFKEAVARAKTKNAPIFVETWAPW